MSTKPKKSTKGKKKGPVPRYSSIIPPAITRMGTRGGSSRQAIKAFLLANYAKRLNVDSFDRTFRQAMKRLTDNGTLIQNNQTFRLSDSAKAKRKRVSKMLKETL